MLLSLFAPMSIRFTPLHLFESDMSLIFRNQRFPISTVRGQTYALALAKLLRENSAEANWWV